MLCRRDTRDSLCQVSLYASITEVHSAAACAAATQSTSAVLIGYDGTSLFHHAAYAASYTARSATWQAMPQATPGAVSTKQRLNMLNGGFQEQARKSRREIFFACNAIMYEQYVILYCTDWAHLSGTQRLCTRPPLKYKREALAVHYKLSWAHTDSRWTQLQALPDSSKTTHSGRRVLRSGGPNHSKLLCSSCS